MSLLSLRGVCVDLGGVRIVDDVSLDLNIEISNISGTGFGGLPTFGNRSINTTIRLHDGETNILAGLIRDDEREVLEGIPGLSDIPVIGRLFARSRRETQETDIIVTLTPRIIRVLDLDEADLRAFRVERDTGAGLDIAAPLPAPTTLGLQPNAVQPNHLKTMRTHHLAQAHFPRSTNRPSRCQIHKIDTRNQ